MEKIKTISTLKTMLREKPDMVVVDIGGYFKNLLSLALAEEGKQEPEDKHDGEYEGGCLHVVVDDSVRGILGDFNHRRLLFVNLVPGCLEFGCRHNIGCRVVQLFVDFDREVLENLVQLVFGIERRNFHLFPNGAEQGVELLFQFAPFRNGHVGATGF